MTYIQKLIKAVKKARLEYQLQRTVDQQAVIDSMFFAAEREAQQQSRIHEELSISLAKKRTALRSQLIRL